MKRCSCGNSITDNYIMCLECHYKKQQLEQFHNWLKKLTNAWLNKDINSIVDLFDNNAVVYDTPYQKGNSVRLACGVIY